MQDGDSRNQGVEIMYDKFDKSKKKDNYKLLDIKQTDRFFFRWICLRTKGNY